MTWKEVKEQLEGLHEETEDPEAMYELERAMDHYQNAYMSEYLEKE